MKVQGAIYKCNPIQCTKCVIFFSRSHHVGLIHLLIGEVAVFLFFFFAIISCRFLAFSCRKLSEVLFITALDSHINIHINNTYFTFLTHISHASNFYDAKKKANEMDCIYGNFISSPLVFGYKFMNNIELHPLVLDTNFS